MFRVPLVALVAALQCIFPASSSFAQQRVPDVVVEAVMARALVERAAFHACAPLEPHPKETVETIVKTWRADMKDSTDFLLKAGYPENYVRQLVARLDLQKATPGFPTRAALQAYCAMLGDWLYRLSIFQYSIPQFDLQKALKR
jgi:hypothetical protein